MMKTLISTICLFLMLSASSPSTSAQSTKGVSEKSYKEARRVLDAGVLALGGTETFRRVEDITLKYTAKAFQQGQSANPDAAYDVGQEEGMRVIDLRGARSYRDQKRQFRGSSQYSYWGRQILKDKDAFILDVNSNVVYPINSSAAAGNIRAVQRRIPHLLLQTALNRSATLRSLGDTLVDGKLHHVITFADGNQVALYFNARSNLLTKYETLGDDPILGDVSAETIFADYRDVGGLKFPFRIILKYGGEVSSDQTYSEIRINTRPGDELFAMPSDATRGPEVLGPTSVSLRRLADDVYFVNGINSGDVWFYSQMFVVFKDYVLVVEAPLSNDISKLVLAKIESVAPGKPIKYLIPTHYHTDHTGGIREYIAKGATVVTTPGNQRFIAQVAGKQHSIRPDTLSLSPRQPAIEVFKDRRVFKDDQHEIELYNIGPSPHVDEIVVVYLPREKILFVTDLMMTRIVEPFTPRTVTEQDFVEKLRRLNLDVETIANGHGWVGTMANFLSGLGSPAPK